VPKVLNKRHDRITPGAVYVGRPTAWGNPFAIGKDGSRAQIIESFEKHLLASPQLMAKLHELRGRDLVCWCAPDGCHADVLMRHANPVTG